MHPKETKHEAWCAATCTQGHNSEAEVPTLRYQGCWFQGTRSSRFRQKLNSILSHQKEVVSMSQYCRSGTPSLGRATVCRAGARGQQWGCGERPALQVQATRSQGRKSRRRGHGRLLHASGWRGYQSSAAAGRAEGSARQCCRVECPG